MNSWPIVSASITRKFTATHALKVAGGCNQPHLHDYTVRFGFRHEMVPGSGLVGSKPLCDWDADCRDAIALVDGKDLNEVLAPRPPTLEYLALFLFAQLPAYYDWVECEAYEPPMTARIDRQRGAKVEWLAERAQGGRK